MKPANNRNVTFWGCLIMSQTAHTIWVSWIFLALAAWIVYKESKEAYEQSKTDLDNSGRGEHGCANGACEQSCKPKQRRNRTKAAEVPSQE